MTYNYNYKLQLLALTANFYLLNDDYLLFYSSSKFNVRRSQVTAEDRWIADGDCEL